MVSGSTIRVDHSGPPFSKLFSFAESLAYKVEEVCLQHLSMLSLKENKLDGLQIGVVLPNRNAIFRFVKRTARPSLNRM